MRQLTEAIVPRNDLSASFRAVPQAEDVQLPGGPKRAGPVVPYAQERDEPGYERVEIGPTSNFVGDHMTQGAVELARADLVRPDRDSIARARLEGRPAPQRIAAEPGTPLETHASDIQLSRPTARVVRPAVAAAAACHAPCA